MALDQVVVGHIEGNPRSDAFGRGRVGPKGDEGTVLSGGRNGESISTGCET